MTPGEAPVWTSANWTLPDFDLKSFVEADAGDEGLGVGSAAIIATAYALVMAVSLFGNLLVCYVVFRHRRLRSVTYTFLVNVALSDLLMTCLNIPFSVSRVLLDHWPFGDVLCSLVPFVQVMSVYVSSLTMAAIAVDRYRVILTPLKRRLRPPHGLIIMIMLWVLASMAALPYALYSEVVPIFTYRYIMNIIILFHLHVKWFSFDFFLKAIAPMSGQVSHAGTRVPTLLDHHYFRDAIRGPAEHLRTGLRRHCSQGKWLSSNVASFEIK